MTIETMLRALAARWYVTLVGLGLTLVAGWSAVQPAPLYWTQSEIFVLAPGQKSDEPPSVWFQESLVSFAAMLERDLSEGPVLRLTSADAPLYGTGVYDGYSVRVPSSGNQWAGTFSRPALSVEVVAADPVTVADRYDVIVQRAIAQADQIQAAQGVAAENRIVLSPVMDDPTVHYVGTTGGQKVRALAAVGLVGVLVTGGVAVMLDSLMTRRRDRRRRAAPDAAELVPVAP